MAQKHNRHMTAARSRTAQPQPRDTGKSYFENLRDISSKDEEVQSKIDAAERDWNAREKPEHDR